jgi:hypothetical protein
MGRMLAAALAALLLIGGMTVHGTAATAERWSFGYGMGTMEARVANERGAAFEVYCPSGNGNDAAPGMVFNASALTKELEKNASYPTTLRIDEDEQSWSFAYIGAKEFQFVAFDAKSVASLAELVDELKSGSALSVAIQEAGADEQFTLDGSAAALRGLLDDCELK